MGRSIWRPHLGLRVWLAVAVGLACLAGGALLAPRTTHAGACGAEGYGWFSGKDFSCEIYGAGGDDVDPGHFDAQRDVNKANFISDVESSRAWRFYVSLINGGDSSNTSKTDFETSVNNPDIGIKVLSRSNALNSLYLPDQNDYAFYTTSPANAYDVPSLVLYSKSSGALYTEIKIDCGNPLNKTPLPKGTDTDPVGQFVSVTCNANGTYDVIVRFHDPDATSKYPTSARLVGNDGAQINGSQQGKDADGSTLNNDPVEWSAPTITNGQWPIQLQVRDVDSEGNYHGYKEVATNSKPQCGDPQGHITASCTASGVSWSGWFYDPDGATTAAESGGGAGAHSYSSDSSNTSQSTAKSFSGSNTSVHPSGMITLVLVVQDKGGTNDYKTTDTATCPGSTSDCPNGTIGGNAQVDVVLSDKTPNPLSGPPAYTTTRGGTYTKYVPSNKIDNIVVSDSPLSGETKITDTSKIATKVSVTSYNTSTNSVTVTLDYTNYITNYPYDADRAAVSYDSHYKAYTYTASTSIDHRDCDDGSTTTPSGSCVRSYSSFDPCSGAWKSQNGRCYYSVSHSPAYTSKTCPYTWYAGSNVCAYHTDANCGSGYKLEYTSSSNGCYAYYTGTAEYAYNTTPTSISGDRTASNTVNAYQMNACRYRNFNVVSVTATASKNSNENPSSGSAWATADVRFSAPKGMGVRVPYNINNGLSFIAEMHGQLLTCSSSASGSFTVTSGSTGTSAEVPAASIPGMSCTIGQPAPLGGEVCTSYTVTPTGDEVSDGGVIVPAGGDGGSVSGSGCSSPVINEPYLKVFGGDVAAGTGFLNGNNISCTNSSTASIQTFNTGVNPYGGSGTALAALSVKPIATNIADEGFASAQGGGVSGSTVAAPKTLSFGNDDPASRYGGDYGSSSSGCSPDYFSGAPAPTAANSLSGAVNLSGLNGTYVASDSLQLSGTITQGQHVLIYSAWPVTITGPIAFTNPGANVADMPSFSLVVKNNTINIAGNVDSLAGNYIAQGGDINDCSTNGNIYTYCSTKLTVYGSFVANNIEFYRMGQNGSLRYSASDSGPGSNNASEEFDYSPATWLAQPPASGTPPAYDAVTSLPPVL